MATQPSQQLAEHHGKRGTACTFHRQLDRVVNGFDAIVCSDSTQYPVCAEAAHPSLFKDIHAYYYGRYIHNTTNNKTKS